MIRFKESHGYTKRVERPLSRNSYSDIQKILEHKKRELASCLVTKCIVYTAHIPM